MFQLIFQQTEAQDHLNSGVKGGRYHFASSKVDWIFKIETCFLYKVTGGL